MSFSAAWLAAIGVAASFLPRELLILTGAIPGGAAVPLVQVLGASYIGFATLNWMNRGAILGGIYGRPITMANFFHFAIGALALVKGAIAWRASIETAVVAAGYSMFAIWFGWVLFSAPTEPARQA